MTVPSISDASAILEAPMGKRLTKIYTRTGDDGTTGLADGGRVPKDHQRIEVLGCLDELNSVIGLIMAQAEPDVPPQLAHIQNRLFDLGAELATPGAERTRAEDVAYLEAALDGYNADLPPLREFILPGGGNAATFCHLARALCRRTERRLVSLNREERLNAQTLRYINRLSDLLFVLARVLARRDGGSEVFWQPAAPE
jgi:cob(I)alamin adenosyltransferase